MLFRSEDISQAWNVKLNNRQVGENSDYIISSLGNSKPLSNGVGGLIMSNINFIGNFDIKTKECRNSIDSILEFYYPLAINYKRIVKKANKKIANQRKNAKILKKVLKAYDFIRLIDENNTIPSYHRFPIYVNDVEYDNILKILDKCNINYQKEYKNKLDKINIVKKLNIKVAGNNIKEKCLLLKTNNNYLNLKKFEIEMGRYYGS